MKFKLSGKTLCFSSLFLCLLGFGILLNFAGYTFQAVDQIYCRGFLPWASENSVTSCDHWRSGDDIFENDFIVNELKYLRNNPHQQTYSERIMNGYPIADAYTANKHSFFLFLTRFLSPASSINFSALAILFLSFSIGYRVAELLNFSCLGASIFGLLAIPLSYVGLFESWNWSLLGYEFLILGSLELYKMNRKVFGEFCLITGAFLILLSSAYQMILYALMNLVLFGLFYFDARNKKKFFFCWGSLMASFIGAMLVMNFFLFNHYEFLNDSNKLFHQVGFSDILENKRFVLDPIGLFGTEIVEVHQKLIRLIFGDHIGTFANGLISPGPVFFVFFVLGFFALYRKYRIFLGLVLFWLLYTMGILEYFLSLIVGNPFKNETSIRSGTLFFLLSIWPAVYAFMLFLNSVARPSDRCMHWIKLGMGYIIFICSIIVIHGFLKWDKLNVESVYILLSCILFLTGLTLERYSTIKNFSLLIRIIFITSFILPIFARLFLGVPPGTLSIKPEALYYPPTAFQKMLKQHSDLKRTLLVTTSKESEMHPNTPVVLGLGGVTGYRNSLIKNYMELFQYHRLIFEDAGNTAQKFSNFQKSIAYLSNYLRPLQAPHKEVIFSHATKNYFLIHGIDSVIGSHDLEIIDPNWVQLDKQNDLSLWQYKKKRPDFIFSRTTHYIKESIKQLDYMFNSGTWEPEKEVVVGEENLRLSSNIVSEIPEVSIVEKMDGYRLIHYKKNNAPGVLVLPVTYGSRWIARDTRHHTLFKTFKVNYAFLGLLLPKGHGEIELIYNDQASLVNKVISGIGYGIFIILFFILKTCRVFVVDEKRQVP